MGELIIQSTNLQMSYSKLPASSASPASSNPFLRAQEADRQQCQQALEQKALWVKQNQERNDRMDAWLNDCPHELRADLRQEMKTKVTQQAGWSAPRDASPGTFRDIIRGVEHQWLNEIKCAPYDMPRNYHENKELYRLSWLIQSLCQDQHLKRKSWVQEAIDLATKLGFERLAREVIPNIRAWRQEFVNSHTH